MVSTYFLLNAESLSGLDVGRATLKFPHSYDRDVSSGKPDDCRLMNKAARRLPSRRPRKGEPYVGKVRADTRARRRPSYNNVVAPHEGGR